LLTVFSKALRVSCTFTLVFRRRRPAIMPSVQKGRRFSVFPGYPLFRFVFRARGDYIT
jgi:hypothetical protein